MNMANRFYSPQITQSATENSVCLLHCVLFKLCVTLCPLWCIIFSACERRELTYFDEAEVTITADWSGADLDGEARYGATAMFYPTDGSTPLTVLMGDRTRQVIRLKEGTYDVILFNRSFNDFSGVAFRGRENYHTLEAFSKNVETRNDGETRVVTDSPDDLAADTVRRFCITYDMLGNYSPSAQKRNKSKAVTNDPCGLCFAPRKLTQEISVTVHVKGIQNIRTATCTLSGVAESVFLASGKASDATVTQEFELEKLVLDPGSATEGTMSGTFNVFGFDENIPHEMNLTAQLRDGKTEFSGDLGKLTVSRTEEGGVISISIDVSCEEAVPEVAPEGSGDSGFDIDVGGWGDDIETELPL